MARRRDGAPAWGGSASELEASAVPWRGAAREEGRRAEPQEEMAELAIALPRVLHRNPASLGGRRIHVHGVLGWLLSLKYLVRCHHGAKATGRSDAAVDKEGGYLEGAT